MYEVLLTAGFDWDDDPLDKPLKNYKYSLTVLHAKINSSKLTAEDCAEDCEEPPDEPADACAIRLKKDRMIIYSGLRILQFQSKPTLEELS